MSTRRQAAVQLGQGNTGWPRSVLWGPFILSLVAVVMDGVSGRSDETSPAVTRPAAELQPAKQPSEAVLLAVRVAELHHEIERLRFAMGRPREQRPELVVSAAALREVYFQAATLFQKSDRLRFENTNRRAEPPPATDTMDAAAVQTVVETSLETLRKMRRECGIEDGQGIEIAAASTSPSAVFSSIVQANRQLNLMLDERFAPSDVYQQVTLAISYASLLLRQFDGVERIPATPEFDAGKRPVDVYERLLRCLAMVKDIMTDSGMSMLELEADSTGLNQVSPSDVYDIASLLVSELSHLHSQLPDKSQPIEPYYPGVRFPAHVYQRAGILELQLSTLQELVDQHSDWLERRSPQP